MSKLIDLTGQRFGRLTVLYKDNNRITNSGSYWICQCDCGNIKSIKSSSLRRGEITSCGCYRTEQVMKSKIENGTVDNLIGQRFGLLTVIEKDYEQTKKYGTVYWICQCDCGNIKSIRGQNLKRKDENRTISCGCKHKSSGELQIIDILNQNNINYIEQYRFLDLNKKSYDFAIIENNQIIRLIEFDGEQHYKEVPTWRNSLEVIQQRDKEKNEYALSHNIPLVRIPYWERDNITLEMIMGDQYLVKPACDDYGDSTDC